MKAKDYGLGAWLMRERLEWIAANDVGVENRAGTFCDSLLYLREVKQYGR